MAGQMAKQCDKAGVFGRQKSKEKKNREVISMFKKEKNQIVAQVKYNNLQTGEKAQKLRSSSKGPEFNSQNLYQVNTQLLVTLVLGNPLPSSGLLR